MDLVFKWSAEGKKDIEIADLLSIARQSVILIIVNVAFDQKN